MNSHLEELTGKLRETYQRLAGLQLQARQPRHVARANVEQDMKTRVRMGVGVADEKLNISHLPGLMTTR